MIAYTITSANKVWMIDEADGKEIPQWCYNKEGYFVVDTLPDEVQSILDEQNIGKLRETKASEILNAFDKAVSNITTALPHEMVSWRKQEDEARAYVADNTVATPFIDAQLVTRNLGETKEELVNKIIANADAYQIAYATLLGKYQNLTKAIEKATTTDELDLILW